MPLSVVVRPKGCACASPDRLVHDVACKGGKRSNGLSIYQAWLGPHHLGLIIGPVSHLDGWTAQPASRSYRPNITIPEMIDPSNFDKWIGPPPVEGLKNRRFAIEYLLRAEGYRSWEF